MRKCGHPAALQRAADLAQRERRRPASRLANAGARYKRCQVSCPKFGIQMRTTKSHLNLLTANAR